MTGNIFGGRQNEVDELLAALQKKSLAVYLATEELVARDLSETMIEAADTIRTLRAALAGRDATIAAVLDSPHGLDYEEVYEILAASPTDALAADRAQAWDEGYREGYSDGEYADEGRTVNPYTVKKEQADD